MSDGGNHIVVTWARRELSFQEGKHPCLWLREFRPNYVRIVRCCSSISPSRTLISQCWCPSSYLCSTLVTQQVSHRAGRVPGMGFKNAIWQVSSFQPFCFIPASAASGGTVNFTLAIMFSKYTHTYTHRLARTKSSP